MTDITISHAKEAIGDNTSIGDDLVLFSTFEEVPLSSEPRKMRCMFVALCLGGSAQYTVDTKEQKVHQNDVIILQLLLGAINAINIVGLVVQRIVDKRQLHG